MGWRTDHAPRQDELDSCVTCGLCLPKCPTFRLTGSEAASPRGRLTAMSAVAAGIAEVDTRFDEIMSFCLQCRACEPVCPSVVPFGRAMEGARVEIAAQLPTTTRRARARILGRRGLGSRAAVKTATLLAAVGQRLGAGKLPVRLFSRISGLRPLPLRPASHIGLAEPARGERVGSAAVLAGCVQDPWFGSVNDASIALLAEAGYDVSVPPSQTCCGALAAHDGAADEAEALARSNAAAFAGADIVVATAAGCSAHLAGYEEWTGDDALSSRARDITIVVAEAINAGRLPTRPPRGERVAVQDPCHLRHAQRVIDEPRTILRAAGYEPVEIDDDGMCCGAAGLYVLTNPDTSDELGRRKADQVRATGVHLVASANPGCEMQLRSALGGEFTVRHPVEIYAEALGLSRAFS